MRPVDDITFLHFCELGRQHGTVMFALMCNFVVDIPCHAIIFPSPSLYIVVLLRRWKASNRQGCAAGNG